MDKYLVHLIKQNKRIIIPEIGAFIVRQEDPLEIGFNGLLTFNDGMLTDHISKVEGISNQEAVAKVEEYKNQLLKDLEQKKEIILQDIGKLNLDESGEKVFVSWKDVGKKAEAKAEAKEEEKKAAAAAAEVQEVYLVCKRPCSAHLIKSELEGISAPTMRKKEAMERFP